MDSNTEYPDDSDIEDSSTESTVDSDSDLDMDSNSDSDIEIDFLIIEACVPGPRASVSSRSRASATSSRSRASATSSQSAPMRSPILQQRVSKSLGAKPLSIPLLAPGEKWIPYVKSVQAENNLSYSDALKVASSPYREQKAANEAAEAAEAASGGRRRRAMYY